MKKRCTVLAIAILMSLNSLGQVVNIPDANLKNHLLSDLVINSNGDVEIQLSEAVAYTGVIECSNLGIASMTGIEAFVNLTELNCSDNQLSSLDVSLNTALTQFRCYNNQLVLLDISANTALVGFSCAVNQLTSLDVSQNVQLESFACSQNQLPVLDVSSNSALEWLWCGENQLSSIDVAQNTALTHVYCNNNQITALDVSSNVDLVSFACFDNQLTSLNISQNSQIETLWCHNNLLTALDASQVVDLMDLSCSGNNLIELNVANGNNLNFTSFRAANNTGLDCIQVDSVEYSNANWTGMAFSFDAGAQFSEDCTMLGVNDEKEQFEFDIYPMPFTDYLNINSSEEINYTITALDGKAILSGSLNVGLNQLDCRYLSSGAYMLLMTSNSGTTLTKKLLKR